MSTAPRRGPRIIRTLEDLDGAWLQATLQTGPIASFAVAEIGTGQMSESHRLSLAYADPERAGPPTAVLKLASADPSSRATGVGLGIYAREVRFYRELAPHIGGPLAACYVAGHDEAEGWFTLLLEDVAPASAGDQIAGCSLQQARLAMRELARLHAPSAAGSRSSCGGRASASCSRSTTTPCALRECAGSRPSTAGASTAARRLAAC